MNNSTSPFIPMGPLRYLIMSKEDKALLGLYTYAPTGETVLKAWLGKQAIYCWPTGIQLMDLLEDRIAVHDALYQMRKTTEDLRPLSGIEQIVFGGYCFLDMPYTIMRLKNVVVHPNFYYVFQSQSKVDNE